MQKVINNSPSHNLRQLSPAVDLAVIDLDSTLHPNSSHYFHSADWNVDEFSANLCKTGCCRSCDAMMWWRMTMTTTYYVCNPFYFFAQVVTLIIFGLFLVHGINFHNFLNLVIKHDGIHITRNVHGTHGKHTLTSLWNGKGWL